MGQCAPSKAARGDSATDGPPKAKSTKKGGMGYAQVDSPMPAAASTSRTDPSTEENEEALTPSQVRMEVQGGDLGDEAGTSEYGKPRDDLERKLQPFIDKARLSAKERELHNAVESLERTNELLRESHRRQAAERAEELCSCVAYLLADRAATAVESGKADGLLRNQRAICEKLQNANELIDAERLAVEYQKYERETELEELRFKYLEVKEKYDMQEGLHQKEQRAFESASQELRIKYEKHFKSLSSEIENLQRHCSSLEGTGRAQIAALTAERDRLDGELREARAELGKKAKELEEELESRGRIVSKIGRENTALNFVVDSMERNLVGLGDAGISDLLEEVLATSGETFQEFSDIASGAVADVRLMSREVSRAKDQMESSQLILHATRETLSEWRAEKSRELSEVRSRNSDLEAENEALAAKLRDAELEAGELRRSLQTEKKTRKGYQQRYLMYKEATPVPSRGLRSVGGKAGGEDAGDEMFYTPMPMQTPMPYAETYSSPPIQSDPREEGELELMGQLDAQKTLEEVEKQVFQMLREESLERPRRSSTQIVQEILTEEKRQMDTIRRRREDEQQTNTKKKLESYLMT